MSEKQKTFDDLIRILESIHPGIDYRVKTDIWESAILDSMELVQLIARLEEEFDFAFDEETLVPETFDSAVTIWAVVQGRQKI